MEITNTAQPVQQAPATQSYKYYSEQELLDCLKGEHITVKAVLSLIESNFEKNKAITELTHRQLQTSPNGLPILKRRLSKNPDDLAGSSMSTTSY